jgi:aspartate aminotransferase
VAAWFAKAHGLEVAPNEVMVSAGAKQVIFNAFHAVLDEGDEIILPAPYWVSYSEIAKLAGAKPVPVVSRAEDQFVVNPDAVARAITPRTRMLLVVSPCNPTGAVYDEKTLRALADLAVKHDLWLLTDDIYRTLIYGDAKFFQPATFGPEVRKRTIIADGVSKAFAMTGWRVGFALAPPPVIEAMGTLQGQSTTNAAAVSQAAALAAIEGPTDELEKMRLEFDKRRKYMVQALRAIPGVKCVEPKGAFYAFPDLSAFNGRKHPTAEADRRRPACASTSSRRPRWRWCRLGVLRAGLRAPVVRHLAGATSKKVWPGWVEALGKLK